ncbi:MAG: hypothetical protein HYV27_09385 [Candidatus Hydrogenedentes bacterium]|nr:hypothetical protein [Candidatus Hydrogenedentota bacterium]
MNTQHTQNPSERGMALLLALMFISMALIALATMMGRMMAQRNQVSQFDDYKKTFEGVESAIITSKYLLESGGEATIGLTAWDPQYDSNGILQLPGFDDSAVDPIVLDSMDDVQYFAFASRWMDDGRDSNGDGLVDDTSEKYMYSVHAAATKNNMVRKVEVIYEGGDVNVWRNAIFAGTGQAGGLINGNVSIHGSVHLLGDNLLEGNAALAAIDLSGTSLIHNNYIDIPAALLARIPALPQTIFEGETVSTLEANLRVKNGLVGMSGNSEIGEPQVLGNASKETMDGTLVNDGWTGTAVTPDGDRGDPKSVFSDNGWDESYDLGNKVPFPVLADDWRDPTTGAKVENPATGTWYTHEDYFNQVLVADPNVTNDGVYTGDITLNVKTSKFYWNATTGALLNGSLPAALPPATDDYIYFDCDSDVMRVNGQVRINGNLSFTGLGGDRTVNYSGRAALMVYGDVSIDTHLVTCNNGNTASTANSFPVSNILGIMASNNMVVGSTAQLDIMGAFYAQQKITSAKQTNVIGTFVSNYFDMGTNVPNIFQVPSLADNLPLGMIGNYPILSLSQVAWRELGIE